MTTTLIIIGVVLAVVVAILFFVAERFIKGDMKKPKAPLPKIDKPLEKISDIIIEAVEGKPDAIIEPEPEPAIVVEENAVEDEIATNQHVQLISSVRKNRMNDYHQNRWGSRGNDEITIADNADDFVVTQDDIAKLAALRDLFEPKK